MRSSYKTIAGAGVRSLAPFVSFVAHSVRRAAAFPTQLAALASCAAIITAASAAWVLQLYPCLNPAAAQTARAGAQSASAIAPTARAIAPNVVRLRIGGGDIDVLFERGDYLLPRETYLRWVATAATSVTRYYGKFPVKKLLVRLSSTGGDSVAFSTAGFEGNRPVIEIPIGRNISERKLMRSWEATHEMVHLAFPMVEREDKWLKEGMATYIEPIARMQVNDLSASKVWGDLFESLPDGLLENDSGLKNASSIDRIYWGGALYCLVADLEIRRRTNNQRGLQDALAAIPAAGGNFESEWSTLECLRIADKAVGVKVLEPLYLEMHNKPLRVNLPYYWKQLGVRRVGDQIVFDDSAPLASVRLSINKGGSGRGSTNASGAGKLESGI